MNNIKEYGNSEDVLDSAVRSIDAETIVLQGEADRRKPLSLAEKRKRNETLAIGLSRTELLVSGSKEKTIKGFTFFYLTICRTDHLISFSFQMITQYRKGMRER